MKPVGQEGLRAVTFLMVFPFLQVIVIFLTAGFIVTTGDGVGVGVAEGATTTGSGAFWVSFAEIVGDE